MRILKLFPAAKNPLEAVLETLTTSPEPVTLKFLDWVNDLLYNNGVECNTYHDVISFLEFMQEHNLLELQKNNNIGVYTIKKIKEDYGS